MGSLNPPAPREAPPPREALSRAYESSVLYIEDFDDLPAPRTALAGEAPDDTPDIIVPGYTAEDVESAREEGHAAGLEEARTEQQAVNAALCTAALAAIGDALAAGRADAGAIAAHAADDIAAGLLGLLTAALPVTAAKLAPAEVGGLLDALLPPLARAPGVTLRLHPDVLPSVTPRLAGFSDMTATADPDLAPSDLILAWRDGEARRDWATLWAGLRAALAPFELPDDLAALLRDADRAEAPAADAPTPNAGHPNAGHPPDKGPMHHGR